MAGSFGMEWVLWTARKTLFQCDSCSSSVCLLQLYIWASSRYYSATIPDNLFTAVSRIRGFTSVDDGAPALKDVFSIIRYI